MRLETKRQYDYLSTLPHNSRLPHRVLPCDKGGKTPYHNIKNQTPFGYDSIGQLVAANAKESGGVTNRLNEQFGYAYDKAHNLYTRTNNALVQSFGVNALNELTNEGNSGTFTVAGTVSSNASSVKVNGTNAVLYYDSTFALNNVVFGSGTNTYTAIANDSYGRSSTNKVSFVGSGATFVYDLNGNLLSDGVRSFVYDDENELISVWVTNSWRSDFVYDGKLRRRIAKEYTWQSGAWTQTNEVHYVYDGNLVVQERDANNTPLVTYTRGADLSGSLQSAGGIGGLLAMSQGMANPQHYYYHADGNGNITMLLNGKQAVAAKYLYDPYGNILAQSGPMADVNTYRFSSKEFHKNSGSVYYLYRYYEPNLQRWLNRDPIQENGGINLFSIVSNRAVNQIDLYGLWDPENLDDPHNSFRKYVPKGPSRSRPDNPCATSNPCPPGQTQIPRYQAMGITLAACSAARQAANPCYLYTINKGVMTGIGTACGAAFAGGLTAGNPYAVGAGGYLGGGIGAGMGNDMNNWAASGWCNELVCK